jgi:hypothetical protein
MVGGEQHGKTLWRQVAVALIEGPSSVEVAAALEAGLLEIFMSTEHLRSCNSGRQWTMQQDPAAMDGGGWRWSNNRQLLSVQQLSWQQHCCLAECVHCYNYGGGWTAGGIGWWWSKDH